MATDKELNEALKSIGRLEEGESAKIVDLEDTIKFNCKQCGKCCSGRSDIILNPFDVYQIAKALNITTQDVINNYCEIIIGNNSCLPVIVLKEDNRRLCPFLKFFATEGKFKCSINNYKPGACIMHPIGVIRSYSKEKDEEITQYIEVPSCSTHGTDFEIKVKDFIKPYLDKAEQHKTGSTLVFEVKKYIDTIKFIKCFSDKDEEELNKLPEEISNIIRSFDSKITNVIINFYVNMLVASAYDFDINKDFLEQVEEVKQRIKDTSVKFIGVTNILGVDISTDNITEDDKKVMEDVIKGFDSFMDDFNNSKGE